MRTVTVLAVLAVVAGVLAPGAAGKTAPIRPEGGGADHGRAGATWTAWKVRGVQVGVRLSAVTVTGFTSDWTEGHALSPRIGLRCKYPTVKTPVTPGWRGKSLAVAAVQAGVPLSVSVPGGSARCLAPSKFLGTYFIGVVIKPYFHPAYVARLSGSGIVPG